MFHSIYMFGIYNNVTGMINVNYNNYHYKCFIPFIFTEYILNNVTGMINDNYDIIII